MVRWTKMDEFVMLSLGINIKNKPVCLAFFRSMNLLQVAYSSQVMRSLSRGMEYCNPLSPVII